MDWIKHRLIFEIIIVLSFFYVFIIILFLNIPQEKSNILEIVRNILKEIP